MLERIRAFIREYQMIEPGGKIVAGISGGPDSVCLLFLLKSLCREMDAKLYAVHVNHGLRGREACDDETFVRKLCAREGISLRVFFSDVRARSKKDRMSLEEAGRICRYEAFREEAARLGGARIAVAHHADDQAETVLFRLFRGTGLRGLCGMEPVRNGIIRPLLIVRRDEILHWLKAQGIEWRTDSSNESPDYARNRIRNELLTYVSANINAQAVRHVAETAEELLETERYLEKKTEEAFRLCVRQEEDGCFLFETGFQKLEAVIQGRLLRRCLDLYGGLKDVERIHIQSLLELMGKQTGSRADLPGKRSARRDYKGIRIGTASTSTQPDPVRPQIPGSLQIDGQIWTFSLEAAQKDQRIPQKKYTKWFDYDKIEKYLEIRRRRPGDYLEINREHGRKKLKAYLVDEKIAAPEREKLWLLADGSHILWVLGHRISEGYKVTSDTRKLLKVQIDGGKENG